MLSMSFFILTVDLSFNFWIPTVDLSFFFLQVKLEQGVKVIKIFKDHASKTCILDDFVFYESRQKIIQERKSKHLQIKKQATILSETNNLVNLIHIYRIYLTNFGIVS